MECSEQLSKEPRKRNKLPGRVEVRRPLVLLWTEFSGPSTAPGRHLEGTLLRLESLGISGDEVIAPTDSSRGLFKGTRRIVGTTFRGLRAASKGTLLARYHPLLFPVTWLWKRRGGKVCLLVQGRLEDIYDSHSWITRVPFFERLAKGSIKHADSLAVAAEGLRYELSTVTGRDPDEILYLPNGVNTEIFAVNDDTSAALGISRPYAVFVGNMAGWQGIDTILSAQKSSAWPPIDLVFIGDGRESHLVKDSLSDEIRWLGSLEQSEVVPWMKHALVGLAPKKDVTATKRGISPFKIIEYAAAGIPVVTTRLAGQQRMVETLQNCIQIENDDSEELAQSVRFLFENKEERDKLGSRGALNSGLFDWKSQALTLKKILGT